MPGLWDRLRGGLQRTRQGLGDRVRGLFAGRAWDDSLFESLEEVLYEADLGVEAVEDLIGRIRVEVQRVRPREASDVVQLLHRAMVETVGGGEDPFRWRSGRPLVLVLVGVNGTGKTTTAGKLAKRLHDEGKTVVLGAADTFRAAATEQLQIWAERSGAALVRQGTGADAAAVAFDTVQAAKARRADAALIDTAGRLHNKGQLMQELAKIARVIGRAEPGAPDEVWLVLDATTGQNGLQQARVFLEAVTVTGIVLTKLDGTAKGGIALAIRRELGIPIRFVGVGERAEDLLPFDPEAYVGAILDTGEPG